MIRSLLAAFLLPLLLFATPGWSQLVIVDNADPGFSRTTGWFSSANAGFYGTNSLVVESGPGSETATWTPAIPAAGVYEVSAWWVASGNRPSNAPYTITDRRGASTVQVDQRADGSQWNSLGEFEFEAGSDRRVTLSNNANGAFLSADAVRFAYQRPLPGQTPGGTCGPTPSALVALSSQQPCHRCGGLLLPGALEPHPEIAYDIHSDLPEVFTSPGVLYATLPVLPPFEHNGQPLSESSRTQNSTTQWTGRIDDDFGVFFFHIAQPGNGTQPRRLAIYARNSGTAPLTADARQVIVTDGIIANVHQMESVLGQRTLAGDWDRPVGQVTLQPGQGAVLAYSKRFAIFPNGPDASANVNAFGRVEVDVEAEGGTAPDLTVYVLGLPGQPGTSQSTLTALAEQHLTIGANSGETSIDLSRPYGGCSLSRATGVHRAFIYRSNTLVLDADQLANGGNMLSFPMALPQVQTQGCTTAQQTSPQLLWPIAAPPDTVGNYMIEYRVDMTLVNRSTALYRQFDVRFGKTDADIGLALQTLVSSGGVTDEMVKAAPVRTAWAGPNQTGDRADNTQSFLPNGDSILLAPCGSKVVSLRFQVLGNSSLPFTLQVEADPAQAPPPPPLSTLSVY